MLLKKLCSRLTDEILKAARMLAMVIIMAGVIFAFFFWNQTEDLQNSIAKIENEASKEYRLNGQYVEKITSFQSLPYFDQTRFDRYVAYYKKHEKLGKEVIWQVNVDLDIPYKKEKRKVLKEENPLLVNKHYNLTKEFVPENLVIIEGGMLATPDTARAYRKMTAAAAEEKQYQYTVVSAYRSYETQEQLFHTYNTTRGETIAQTSRYSAYAGSSEHQTGRAIDLTTPGYSMEQFGDSIQSDWIYQNCYKYGFIVRYQASEEQYTGYKDEPWHITYVGQKIARDMHKREILSLEEYVGKHPEATL
ncbi:MAG: M15 family metallopeptidase [Lachnospiraceae bacterium]